MKWISSRRLCWPLLLAFVLWGCEEQPAPPPAASAAASPPAAASPSAAPTAAAPPATASAAPAAAEAPEAVAAQHILIAYRGAKGAGKTITRSKADAKKRAEEVLAKIQGGTDFTSLVKEYSDDPGSAERLGNVGKFKRDAMVKPFSDAAFALKVNDVSGIVETPFGFHIIKRNQ